MFSWITAAEKDFKDEVLQRMSKTVAGLSAENTVLKTKNAELVAKIEELSELRVLERTQAKRLLDDFCLIAKTCKSDVARLEQQLVSAQLEVKRHQGFNDCYKELQEQHDSCKNLYASLHTENAQLEAEYADIAMQYEVLKEATRVRCSTCEACLSMIEDRATWAWTRSMASSTALNSSTLSCTTSISSSVVTSMVETTATSISHNDKNIKPTSSLPKLHFSAIPNSSCWDEDELDSLEGCPSARDLCVTSSSDDEDDSDACYSGSAGSSKCSSPNRVEGGEPTGCFVGFPVMLKVGEAGAPTLC